VRVHAGLLKARRWGVRAAMVRRGCGVPHGRGVSLATPGGVVHLMSGDCTCRIFGGFDLGRNGGDRGDSTKRAMFVSNAM